MDAIIESLTDRPQQFADCCCALSWPLVNNLVSRLPSKSSLVLSIGSGSGLLEEILHRHRDMNIYGVEVPTCINKYLPNDRVLRVSSVESCHSEVVLAEAILFVYPRSRTLIHAYLRNCFDASYALQCVCVISGQTEYAEFADLFARTFEKVEVVENSGLAPYEVLAVANMPKHQ